MLMSLINAVWIHPGTKMDPTLGNYPYWRRDDVQNGVKQTNLDTISTQGGSGD